MSYATKQQERISSYSMFTPRKNVAAQTVSTNREESNERKHKELPWWIRKSCFQNNSFVN